MPATSPAQERLMQAAAHTPGGFGGVSQAVGREFVADSAAGIAFTTPDNKTLLLLRKEGSRHGGTWGFPGGKLEADETPEQAARREVLEETGYAHAGPVRQLRDFEGFTAFHAQVDAEFPVTLCDESAGYVWADAAAMASLPLHPGTADTMRIAAASDELDVARLMVDGLLASPQRCGNMSLFRMRVTGTGLAFRSKDDEFVYRPPEVYLNSDFLARCAGLPVILEHPKDGQLDSDEYRERNVGSIMMAYINGEDVDAIVRIYDDPTVEMLADNQLSTSPTVIFRDIGENDTVTLENGQTLLIEGKPCLLDHLAICVKGVWDKGGDPTGVEITNHEVHMPDITTTAAADTTVQPAVAPVVTDGLLSQLIGSIAGLTKRFDSFEEKVKTEPTQTAADKAKVDAEAEEATAKAKADADEEAEKKAKADAEMAIADAAEEEGKSEAQAKADSVYSQFGQSAPRAMQGESLIAYRRRLADKLKIHSPDYKDIKLTAIADSDLLAVAERRIYADAATAARLPASLPEGQLVEIKKADPSGRMISTFHGSPNVWMGPFRSPARRVERINKEH